MIQKDRERVTHQWLMSYHRAEWVASRWRRTDCAAPYFRGVDWWIRASRQHPSNGVTVDRKIVFQRGQWAPLIRASPFIHHQRMLNQSFSAVVTWTPKRSPDSRDLDTKFYSRMISSWLRIAYSSFINADDKKSGHFLHLNVVLPREIFHCPRASYQSRVSLLSWCFLWNQLISYYFWVFPYISGPDFCMIRATHKTLCPLEAQITSN